MYNGKDALVIFDDLTRHAWVYRQITLLLRRAPGREAYPGDIFYLHSQLMERAGKEEGKGSITAFFTVLIEGDDMSDPIADQSRSILDGHIVLSREMTDFGIYPPVHILNSASRVMNDIISQEHFRAVMKFRRLYTLLKENETLIRIGAYTKGSDSELDEAITKKEKMEKFISQGATFKVDFDETLSELLELMQESKTPL